MNVSKLFKDDDAVSPVIGVILMVAITVILAAVIGAFVLNIGGSQSAAPTATINFENTSSGIEVSHQSGEKLPGSEVTVKVTGSLDNAESKLNLIKGISNMGAGDSFYIVDSSGYSFSDTGGTAVPSGTEVTMIWDSPSSDKSSIIAEYTAT